jgi:rhodanese-related sulfurtransferase
MVQQIDVQTLRDKLNAREQIVLVDVRQPWEHEFASLPNSLLIPLDQLPQRVGEIDCPEGAILVAYCHHGVRSVRAAAYLAHAGFQCVVSLAGGIDAWSVKVDPTVPRYC